jgi:hypothetical protein
MPASKSSVIRASSGCAVPDIQRLTMRRSSSVISLRLSERQAWDALCQYCVTPDMSWAPMILRSHVPPMLSEWAHSLLSGSQSKVIYEMGTGDRFLFAGSSAAHSTAGLCNLLTLLLPCPPHKDEYKASSIVALLSIVNLLPKLATL